MRSGPEPRGDHGGRVGVVVGAHVTGDEVRAFAELLAACSPLEVGRSSRTTLAPLADQALGGREAEARRTTGDDGGDSVDLHGVGSVPGWGAEVLGGSEADGPAGQRPMDLAMMVFMTSLVPP